MHTTTKETEMTTTDQAFAEHIKASDWVDHYHRQLAGAERILACRRERGTLAELSQALTNVHHDRLSLLYWQRRLDSIECPEA